MPILRIFAENRLAFAENICYDEEKWKSNVYTPKFFWDQERIIDLLSSIHQQQGRLIGGMGSIGFRLREEALLQALTQDVVKSSEIEGEILDQSLVRSSVARHLGMDIGALSHIDRHVEGVVEMVLDATQRFDKPLTQERLFKWHHFLFPTKQSGFKKIRVGTWRLGPVEVISGKLGKEIIHFEGPSAERVGREMDLFLKWFGHEHSVDHVLKAAIAHLWFITIHPFDDGNGRIGRAIADLLLARSEKSSDRFYSLSTQIQKDRKNYYAILEKTQKGDLDITQWIIWFLTCLERAIQDALSTIQMITNKTKFWEAVQEKVINDRQRKIINRLLEGFEGRLTSSKWAKIAKCSQDTAYRDILDLIEKGILEKNQGGGRSTSYSLVQERSFTSSFFRAGQQLL
jgi:Fic family protein